MEKETVKNWFSENAGGVIAIISLAASQIWGYARLWYQQLAHGKRLDKVEGDIGRHVDAGELHRNPDFEQRFEEIRSRIDQINIKLDRLIARRP